MELYWVLGIAFVIFWSSVFTVEAILGKENSHNGIALIMGALASILFVLIMIYDKL